ncbi:MAG: FhaA domain-containing protein [Candidatus Sericytochromatia bacterium]
MGFVQRIERKLEDAVGDVAARMFGGAIVPQELEAALRREAGEGVHRLEGGHLLAPNEYVVTLSEPDYAKAVADRALTSDTFAKHLVGYIREQGWQTYGDVVVRFEQSPKLHTGQFRARAAVNPDAMPAPPQPPHEPDAQPGVAPMSDNPSYRSGPGQGRPDEYYDERYNRPPEESRGPAGPDPRAAYPPPPEQGGYQDPSGYPPPPQPEPGYPPRGGYPDQGGYGDPGGYPDQGYTAAYEQRPAPGYGPPPSGYEQAPYRQGPPSGGYGPQPGYGGQYDYGRPPAPPPGRHEGPGYGPPEPRYDYDQGGYPQQGQPYGQPDYGQPDYGQPEYGRYDAPAGYGAPQAGEYEYGQAGYAGGYGQGDYAPVGHATVTLQLDDGSGRTYQLREGANVIGRGQDAQFRLPDTGVSRRHLEIRWDGQTALLSDLNSTNGTTVNNAPVQEWQLADGDVIRLGHSEIIVHMH